MWWFVGGLAAGAVLGVSVMCFAFVQKEKQDDSQLIVLCKQCKFWHFTGGYGYDAQGNKKWYGLCDVCKRNVKEDHFCSYGKNVD